MEGWFECLVGSVADGNDEVGGLEVGERARFGVAKVDAPPGGGFDGAGVNPVSGPGAGAGGGRGVGLVPDGLGELRSGCVLGADENDPVGEDRRTEIQAGEGSRDETGVSAASIALGGHPFDDPELFERAEVMGEQVGVQVKHVGQLGRGAVGCGQLVDDRQPGGISERGVQPGPLRDLLNSPLTQS